LTLNRFPLALLLAIAACDGTTADPNAASDDQAQVISSSAVKVVSAMQYGDTSTTVQYTDSPKYRAVSFQALAGDRIDAWVRSDDGDAVAWLLDSQFHVLARNDNASYGESNSHIAHKVTTSGMYYVSFREHDGAASTFKVFLNVPGVGNFYSCKSDADCVAVRRDECCGTGWLVAVNKDQKQGYADSYTCPQAKPICPLYIIDDTDQAECNVGTHACEMVKIKDIKCGGFTVNPHQCPADYTCRARNIPDVPGSCVQN
jgi:hypothetical protein